MAVKIEITRDSSGAVHFETVTVPDDEGQASDSAIQPAININHADQKSQA